MSPKLLTLCIVHQGNRVLLGMKKRGFGAGRFNGFGGKVEERESIEEAVVRETVEEAGITPLDPLKLGIIEFFFIETGDTLQVHIFKSKDFEGTVGESEEMCPEWFAVDEIPFEKMWKDDIFWFPLFLENKLFKGRFSFDRNDSIVNYTLTEVKTLT